MSNHPPSVFSNPAYSLEFNGVTVRVTTDQSGQCHFFAHDLKRAWGLLADDNGALSEDDTSKLCRDEALYLTALFLGEGVEAALRSKVDTYLAAVAS